jgi:hypothetical protein
MKYDQKLQLFSIPNLTKYDSISNIIYDCYINIKLPFVYLK